MGRKDVKETARQDKAEKRRLKAEEVSERKRKKEENEKREEEMLLEEYNEILHSDLTNKDNTDNIEFQQNRKAGQIDHNQEREDWGVVEEFLEYMLGKYSYLVKRFLDKPKVKKNHMMIPNVAKASLRFNTSPAATAAICSSYLQDLISAGHLSSDLSYLSCDPNKVRRARTLAMSQAKNIDQRKLDQEKIQGIYFDGRKDNTLLMQPDSRGILHKKIEKEYHVSVTCEPEGKYLDHFTPDEPIYPEKPALKEAEGLYDILCSHGAT